MKRLRTRWPRIRRDASAAGRVVLFLDFDGTLAPLVQHPSLARLPNHVRSTLERLRSTPRAVISIISGRQLQDLKRRVRVSHISYIANHGLEAEGPYGRYCHPVARRSRPVLTQIARELRRVVRPIPGAVVEHKGLTLSVHYRQVPAGRRPALRQAFRRVVQPHVAAHQVRVCFGKAVWDVRPHVDWHKGAAIEWLLRRMRAPRGSLVICLGDDRTDEDAFRTVNRLKGISVVVGKRRVRTAARYVLADVRAVSTWLRSLERMLSQW